MSKSLIPVKKEGALYRQRKESRRLGGKALVVGVGSAAATMGLAWLSTTLGMIGGVIGIGYTGVHVWKWLKYRGKWGLYF